MRKSVSWLASWLCRHLFESVFVSPERPRWSLWSELKPTDAHAQYELAPRPVLPPIATQCVHYTNLLFKFLSHYVIVHRYGACRGDKTFIFFWGGGGKKGVKCTSLYTSITTDSSQPLQCPVTTAWSLYAMVALLATDIANPILASSTVSQIWRINFLFREYGIDADTVTLECMCNIQLKVISRFGQKINDGNKMTF